MADTINNTTPDELVSIANSLASSTLTYPIKKEGISPEIIRMWKGIQSIVNFGVSFVPFERALRALKNAKNSTNLTAVEAALRSTMEEVKNLYLKKSHGMDKNKAAEILYTLQNLILNLQYFELPKNMENIYIPKLLTDLENLQNKANDLNLDVDNIFSACCDNNYQIPGDPLLNDFSIIEPELINYYTKALVDFVRTGDETKLPKAFFERSNKTVPSKIATSTPENFKEPYQSTLNNLGYNVEPNKKVTDANFYNDIEGKGFDFLSTYNSKINPLDNPETKQETVEKELGLIQEDGIVNRGFVSCVPCSIPFLEKFIIGLIGKYGSERVSVDYIKDHVPEFFETVNMELGKGDREVIAKVVREIVIYLVNTEKTIQQRRAAMQSRRMPESIKPVTAEPATSTLSEMNIGGK